MLPIHTILHATDFSEHSTCAWQLACALTRDYGSRLIALHVAPRPVLVGAEGALPPHPDLHLEGARTQLERLAVPAGNVRAERRLEEGDPAAQILRVATEVHADLIVMGTHGRTGLSRLVMGSVAEEVVRKSPCPVLTVKTPVPESVPEPATPLPGSQTAISFG
jgi:nucleotide-binding universal stress UspA family protein